MKLDKYAIAKIEEITVDSSLSIEEKVRKILCQIDLCAEGSEKIDLLHEHGQWVADRYMEGYDKAFETFKR